MPVPYIFANTPGGASIPLSELDDNFAYVLANTTGPTGPTGPTGAPSTVTGPTGATGYTGPTGAVASLVTATNVAALRAIAVSTSYNVLLEGYYANGDGGGGQFYGVTGASPGTYVENGGTVILPTGGNGSSAWLRIIDGPINIRWFGAKGDGTTDDTAAIQAAIIYAEDLITPVAGTLATPAVYIPVGNFLTTSPLIISATTGFHLFGETIPSYNTASCINYTGSDFAIRIQYGVVNSSTSITIGSGSKTFTTSISSSNSPIVAGDTVLIRSTANEANFMAGTVTSFSGNTLVVNVANTGGSGTFASWTISDSVRFTYRINFNNFGIYLPNSCEGGIYGWNIQESYFQYLSIIGNGPIASHPNYTSNYGMRFDSIALSKINFCVIQQHQNAIYIPHAPYNMQESGPLTLTDLNVFAVRNGIVLSHMTGCAIQDSYFELFETGVFLSNSALLSGITVQGLDIINCFFGTSLASTSSRAISVIDVNTAKTMYVDSLQINNCQFASSAAGSFPAYAIDFDLNPSNGFFKFYASIYDNFCYGPTTAFIRCDDSRAALFQYENIAYTDYNLTSRLPLLASGTQALSGTYLLARDTQSGAYAPSNTSENVILSVPIPPNLIGPSGSIKITAHWSVTSNANNKTLRVRINGIAGTILCEQVLSTGNAGCTFNTQITNDTAATAQNSISWIFVRAATPSLANYNSYSTADTTALTTLDFTAQKAVAGDTVLVYAWLIEAYPN